MTNSTYFYYADLAKGGCMVEYNWNGGGFYNRKPWNEDLPTDSAVK